MLRLNIGDAATLSKAKTELDAKYNEALQGKEQYESIYQAVKNADNDVKKYLKKDTYNKQDLAGIKATDEAMQRNVAILNQMLSINETIPGVLDDLNKGLKYYTEQLNYNLNKDFNGRSTVGDDPYNLADVNYGNGNPMNRVDDESHGTHVAGIIAAERNNGKGVNGVANNVAIMSIRAVPNGDEYDKDIARGIRYAVDNGARV